MGFMNRSAKWVFLGAFSGTGLLILWVGAFWSGGAGPHGEATRGHDWVGIVNGLIFFVGGIVSYFGIGSSQRGLAGALDSASWKALEVSDKTGVRGRFRKEQATISSVGIFPQPDGTVFIGLTCDLDTQAQSRGIPRRFVLPPQALIFGHRRVSEGEAGTWKGRKVGVIYNPKNPDDFKIALDELYS